jgi:hypothetical protein
MKKRLDKSTAFVFGLCTFCLMVTFVAIGASAENTPQKNDAQALHNISTGPQELQTNPEKEQNPTRSALSSEFARDLIMRQITAIKDRDAENAMQTTTPRFQKQKKIADSKEFLNKMRFNFRTVYFHKSFEFTNNKRIGKNIIQKVDFTSKDGYTITAIYRLTQSDAGLWLIDSLALMPFKDAEPI